ncbi:hypothetical protein BD560DRAFT_423983 [Blakeslea trispora]|nr:hypothetical protein BD560DRAFT_423983 [Blakeslea trispora]
MVTKLLRLQFEYRYRDVDELSILENLHDITSDEEFQTTLKRNIKDLPKCLKSIKELHDDMFRCTLNSDLRITEWIRLKARRSRFLIHYDQEYVMIITVTGSIVFCATLGPRLSLTETIMCFHNTWYKYLRYSENAASVEDKRHPRITQQEFNQMYISTLFVFFTYSIHL